MVWQQDTHCVTANIRQNGQVVGRISIFAASCCLAHLGMFWVMRVVASWPKCLYHLIQEASSREVV